MRQLTDSVHLSLTNPNFLLECQRLVELFDFHYDYIKEPLGDSYDHYYTFRAGDEDYTVSILHNRNDHSKAYVEFSDSKDEIKNNNRHPKDAHKILITVKHILDFTTAELDEMNFVANDC